MKKLVLGLFMASTCLQLSASDNNSWFGTFLFGGVVVTYTALKLNSKVQKVAAKKSEEVVSGLDKKGASPISSRNDSMHNASADGVQVGLENNGNFTSIGAITARSTSQQTSPVSQAAVRKASSPADMVVSSVSSVNVQATDFSVLQGASTSKGASPVDTNYKTPERGNTPTDLSGSTVIVQSENQNGVHMSFGESGW